jgi:hypothetical protein
LSGGLCSGHKSMWHAIGMGHATRPLLRPLGAEEGGKGWGGEA